MVRVWSDITAAIVNVSLALQLPICVGGPGITSAVSEARVFLGILGYSLVSFGIFKYSRVFSGVPKSFRVFVFRFSAILGFSGSEQEEASNH